jgi:hypothetical protein
MIERSSPRKAPRKTSSLRGFLYLAACFYYFGLTKIDLIVFKMMAQSRIGERFFK